MQEIFENISDELKKKAEMIWLFTISQKTPIEAANFLNTVINYYETILNEEEMNFLRFYFNMQLEMMKE